MRYLVLLCLVWGLTGVACDPGGPLTPALATDFLPLAPGHEWVYEARTEGDVYTRSSLTVRLGDPVRVGGVDWYAVNDACVGARAAEALPLWCVAWAHDGDKILSRWIGGIAVSPEEIMLDLPVAPGKRWFTQRPIDTTYVTTGGDSLRVLYASRRTVLAPATVEVPAGTFPRCLAVADTVIDVMDLRYAGGERVRTVRRTMTTEWYAPGVGMVKQVTAGTVDSTAVETQTTILLRYSLKE